MSPRRTKEKGDSEDEAPQCPKAEAQALSEADEDVVSAPLPQPEE